MLEGKTSIDIPAARTRTVTRKLENEVEALHRRCGVYTKPEVVCRILDAVGWRSKVNLSQCRLLEPAAGSGAFVIEAARRLVASYRRCGVKLKAYTLIDRIKAFELHLGAAEEARSQVTAVLRELGIHPRTAAACARSWIVNDDFLLADLAKERFTHTVGNPPYVRWSKIPPGLKSTYAACLPSGMTGGDLFLPFLDRALEQLHPNGRCGFLCSDRWRFMAFAKYFRRKWLPRLDIASEESLLADDAFVLEVGAYPTILIATKMSERKAKPTKAAPRKGKSLEELGCVIKVGPALGHTPAFVLESDEHDVEPELLHPWVDGSEIVEGAVDWRGRRVITMYGDDGKLVALQRYPLLEMRLQRFADKLEQRSIVRNGAPWFRTIDRVRTADWTRPKLLVPELAKVPRIAIDRSGAIPSHGVYAIFAQGDKVETLYEKLRDGRLAQALDGIAPKVKGGYVRCYRRFLTMVRIEE